MGIRFDGFDDNGYGIVCFFNFGLLLDVLVLFYCVCIFLFGGIYILCFGGILVVVLYVLGVIV